MTARTLFIGGEIGSVTPDVVGQVTESTAGGTFDSTYSRQSLAVATGHYFDCPFEDDSYAADSVGSGDTLFFHGTWNPGGTGNTAAVLLEVRDGSFPWVSFRKTTNAGEVGVYGNTNTGASPTWTLLGSLFSHSGGRQDIDIKVTLGSPHSVEFSIGNSLVASGTFTQASFTSAIKVRCYAFQNISAFWSQLWATQGISTVGGKVFTRAASGAGTTNTGSGAHTDINETTVNDATNLIFSSAGQLATFAMADATLPTGYVVEHLMVETRWKHDGSSPTQLKTKIRSGGANYDYGITHSGSTSYTAAKARWSLDPATSARFTQSGINAFEAGAEAA
ncbi:MAG: hypothetical protein JWO33_1011 [Caulobacteraceae bacterium]|nr:hypothetical protein [Caulobacteraceae bacterium]